MAHAASWSCGHTRALDLDRAVDIARELVGNACHSRSEVAVDTRAQRHRMAAAAHRHLVARADLALLGIDARQLDLGLRALELELRHALHGRAREERLVRDELQALR